MWCGEFCVGHGVSGPQERQLWEGGPCTQLGVPGVGGPNAVLCWAAPLGGEALEEVVLTPQIFWSLPSTGHQTDLCHLHQPCNLAGLWTEPSRLKSHNLCGWCIRPGPFPRALLMSACLVGIHKCGLVLRTVEPPAITAGQAMVGNRRRLSGWGSSRLCHTGLLSGPMLCPTPKHRGSVSRAQAWLFSLLLPPSVLLVTQLVPPHLYVSLLSLLCMCCLSGLSRMFLSTLALPHHLP